MVALRLSDEQELSVVEGCVVAATVIEATEHMVWQWEVGEAGLTEKQMQM